MPDLRRLGSKERSLPAVTWLNCGHLGPASVASGGLFLFVLLCPTWLSHSCSRGLMLSHFICTNVAGPVSCCCCCWQPNPESRHLQPGVRGVLSEPQFLLSQMASRQREKTFPLFTLFRHSPTTPWQQFPRFRKYQRAQALSLLLSHPGWPLPFLTLPPTSHSLLSAFFPYLPSTADECGERWGFLLPSTCCDDQSQPMGTSGFEPPAHSP